jgi:hypothetical protein
VHLKVPSLNPTIKLLQCDHPVWILHSHVNDNDF